MGGKMRRWLMALMGLPLLGIACLAEADAEEKRKRLEELLVDKGVLSAAEAATVREGWLSPWVDRVSFSGDLRLRHESFFKEDPARDRHRQRFRLRLGTEMEIESLLVGFRLASGVGDQSSTNQSFEGFFGQKPLWIDRAYLKWKGPGVSLIGGRMPNPFFRPYSTDAVWDPDINPEGFAESFHVDLSERISLFVHAGQFVLNELKDDQNDPWLFGEQLGGRIALDRSTIATVAVAHYAFKNIQGTALDQTGIYEGNSRVGNTLVNAYRVLDLTGEVAAEIAGIAVVLQGDYIQNLADTTTDEDQGYQVGFKVGKPKKQHGWELAYFYKRVQTDATVADLADSDFGDGGTNRKGHILWGSYQWTPALSLKTKFFMTEVLAESLPPGKDDVDRLQVDLVMKF